MALIDQNTIAQDTSDNPFLGKSPEELAILRKTVEGQIAQRRKDALIGNIQGGMRTVGDMFLQKGGIKPIESKTSDLNDYIMKEMIRQKIRNPVTVGTQEEIPTGYASYGGKLYKLPTTAEGGAKTIKEQALDVLSRNETLPGLSTEETKKVAGVYIPTGKSAAAEKREVEETKLGDELGGLLNSFNRAVEENKNLPGFGATGIGGRIAGLGAKLSGKAGYSPATNVYNAQRKAFATVVAKAAGEVRPTDEDIRRFVATLPDTGKSDDENALLIQDIQDKVSKGNVGALWGKTRPQNIPTSAGRGTSQPTGFRIISRTPIGS